MTARLPFKPVFSNTPSRPGMSASPASNTSENALVAVTIFHLCFLPWALGGVQGWSQLVSLLLSAIEFSLALIPDRQAVFSSETSHRGKPPWQRLLRSSLFWAGLCVLGYVAVQGCNPAWRFQQDKSSWWLEQVRHLDWLPSGVQGPFSRWNAWRSLVIWTSLLLLLCSIQIGFLRKRSYSLLFWSLTINGFVLVLFGLVQRLSGTLRVFWTYEPGNHGFFASLIYPNHAGAYFNLVLALTLGLAWWYHQSSGPGREKSGITGGLIFLAVFHGIAVCMSFSRTSIILLLLLLTLLSVNLFVKRGQKRRGHALKSPFPLLFSLLVAGSFGATLITANSDKLWSRFAPLASEPGSVLRGRALVQKVSIEMFGDRWLLGWGAGSFRYAFPLYAQKYPEIYDTPKRGRQYWEHAHNDFIELLAELGAIGMAPIALIVMMGAATHLRRRFWQNPVSLCTGLGTMAILLHGSIDFVFQCPAVLFTWAVLFLAGIRWLGFDQPCTVSSNSANPGPPTRLATRTS